MAQSFSCVWADPDDNHLLCRQQGLPAATDAWPCMLHVLLLYCSACNLFVIMRCPEKCGAHPLVPPLQWIAPTSPQPACLPQRLGLLSAATNAVLQQALAYDILPAAPRSVTCVLQVPGQRILQRGGHPQWLDPGPALPHDARRQSRVCGVSLAAAGLQSAAPSVVGGCCAPPPVVLRVLHYGKTGMLQMHTSTACTLLYWLWRSVKYAG